MVAANIIELFNLSIIILSFRPKYYDSDPVFEQGFVFLVVNLHSDDLHIKVLDTGHKNSIIGTLVIRMSDLFNQPNLELVSQPLPLNAGGSHALIRLSAQLRCLKKPTPKPIEPPKFTDPPKIDPPLSLAKKVTISLRLLIGAVSKS